MSNSPASFSDVYESELLEIARRRKMTAKAERSLGQHGEDKELEVDPRDTCVGLALSGGGVRSSAFSLGIFQGLVDKGLLKSIDYLSTVSGGGYIGGFLSSAAVQIAKTQTDDSSAPSSTTSSNKNSDTAKTRAAEHRRSVSNLLKAETTGQQTERVTGFINGGSYLGQSRQFFNQYMIGTLLNVAFIASVLVAGTSAIAWAFRLLDYPSVTSIIGILGMRTDIGRAFFPAVVLFVVWLLAWLVFSVALRVARHYRDPDHPNPPRFTKLELFTEKTLLASVLAFFVGIAMLLGTGEINVSSIWQSAPNDGAGVIGTTRQLIKTLIIAAVGASLLPYLKPKQLIQSGAAPQNTTDKVVFWAASRSLVVGVPFLMIGYFAQENISNWHYERPLYLHRNDITDWSESSPLFHDQCNWVWENPESEGDVQWTDLTKNAVPQDSYLDPKFDRDAELKLRTAADMAGFRPKHNRPPAHTASRPWRFLCHLGRITTWGIQGSSHPYSQQYASDARIRKSSDRISFQLNKNLQHPYFYNLLKLDNKRVTTDVAYQAVFGHKLHLAETPKPEDWEKNVSNARREAQTASENLIATRTRAKATSDETEEPGNQQLSKSQEKAKTAYIAAAEALVIEKNRELLHVYFDDTIKANKEIYARNVLAKDQITRKCWCLFAALAALLFGTCVDLNFTSWHGFYSDRIATHWLHGSEEQRKTLKLKELDTVAVGLPYHIVCAAVHTIDEAKKRVDQFIFSKNYCGSDATKYAKTSEFQDGNYRLGDALGISGAAVTPLLTSNPLMTALLFLANIRLGQWLQNPSCAKAQSWQLFSRSPLRAFFSSRAKLEDRSICFVADGGHYENLAVEPLLRRRCKLIIAVDGTEDGDYEFRDFTQLLRNVRLEHGIRFKPATDDDRELATSDEIQVTEFPAATPNRTFKRVNKHYFVTRIFYPDWDEKDPAYLVYIKSSMTGDESQDLLGFQADNHNFPHDPTSNQFYTPERFDAYRNLGHHIAMQIMADMTHTDEDGTVFDASDLITALTSPTLRLSQPKEKHSPADSVDAVEAIILGEATMEEKEAALRDLEYMREDPDRVISRMVRVLNDESNAMLRTRTKLLLSVYGRRDPSTLAKFGFDRKATADTQQAVAEIFAHIFEDTHVEENVVESILELTQSDRVAVRLAAAQALTAYGNSADPTPSLKTSVTRGLLRLIETEASNEVRREALDAVDVISRTAADDSDEQDESVKNATV